MSRRWKNVHITDFMVNLLFRGREDARLTSDWPEDATIVAGSWDHDRAQLVLTIESSSFPEALVGDCLMDFTPSIVAHTVAPSAQRLLSLLDKMHEEELDEAARKA